MDNRTRALQQTISVDGWIGDFDVNGDALVHADIVFRQGAFGEEKEAPVRFKIALRRAEVVLRLPDQSALIVRKETIHREARKESIEQVQKKTARKKAGFLGGLKLKGGKPEIDIDLNAGLEGQASTSTEIKRSLSRYVQQHFITRDNHPAWDIRTQDDSDYYLDGSPWDAVEQPRMKVRRQVEAPRAEIALMIEVRCRREDVEILDLEQKDPEEQRRFRAQANRDKNLAAAEQLIKEELMKAGFMDIPEMDEKHACFLIADKIILQQ